MSLPNTFMITAVLSGNETRDYHEDKLAGVGTLSSHFSYEGSKKLYLALNAIGFPILVIIVALGYAPVACLLALITLIDLYLLIKNCKRAPEDPKSNFMLVPMAFKLNWHFGVLLVLGYIISYYVIGVYI